MVQFQILEKGVIEPAGGLNCNSYCPDYSCSDCGTDCILYCFLVALGENEEPNCIITNCGIDCSCYC